MTTTLTLTECPRDSWQALRHVIPTAVKVAHLTRLLAAGFTSLDCASFVSPRAVPQMADSAAVLDALPPADGVEIIAIVANERGVSDALAHPRVATLGYPLSVNETFQHRNTNRSLADSWRLAGDLVRECRSAGRDAIVYLSMAFGNPYGEPWSLDDTARSVTRGLELGAGRVMLSDTVGRATPDLVAAVVAGSTRTLNSGRVGVHLHGRPDQAAALVRAALAAGPISAIDTALGGIGGCPFAQDDLVGNLPTELVWPALHESGLALPVDTAALGPLASAARDLAAAHP
jgi:hydroxymethylglutaryl-CoA lyase